MTRNEVLEKARDFGKRTLDAEKKLDPDAREEIRAEWLEFRKGYFDDQVLFVEMTEEYYRYYSPEPYLDDSWGPED